MPPLRRGKPWLLFALLIVAAVTAVLLPRGRYAPAADARLLQAAALEALAQPAQAAEQVARAAELTRGRGDLWERAGRLALQGGDPQAAITYLEQGAQAARDDNYAPPGGLSTAGWQALGDAYRQAGDAPAALRAWQTGLVYAPAVPELLERSGTVRLELGDAPGAAADLQALAGLRSQDAAGLYRLGLVQAAYDPPAAQPAFDQAAALDARYAPAAAAVRRALISARAADDPAYTLVLMGRALAGLEEWGMAAKAFARAAHLRPDFAEAWAYLGEARQHPGQGSLLPLGEPDPQAVLADLQRALAADPGSLAGRTFLALYYTRQGRFDQAVAVIDEALAQDPGNPALVVQRAGALAQAGDLPGADAAYRQALALAPRDPAYARYWIEFMLQYNYLVGSQALPAARRLVIDFPNDPAVLDLMARMLLRLQDLPSARRFLDRALAVDPEYAPAWLHLGQWYLLAGRRDEARQALLQAQALAPGTAVYHLAQRLLDDY
ncbi:MAG: tetratricopeptide repeat protein [Chloroflexota bacterium]